MITNKKMIFYGSCDIDKLPQMQNLRASDRFAIEVASMVFPFRTNNYIAEELIDWNNIPDDPIFRLTFPQKEMLLDNDFEILAQLLIDERPKDEIKLAANKIRQKLNPHPAGQLTANVPILDSEPVPGVQHKYRETVLVFPSAGQTCHAYCTFCFRWAQFIGDNDLKFATDESKRFQKYLKSHPEVTDVLFTGGDPMVMGVAKLKAYIEPLLQPEFEHIKNIRIGTKSVSYWPYRYVTDNDSDEILNLFEKVMSSGKHLALMGHYNHWKELSTNISRKAIRRLRNVGVKIRTQSPLIRHVNDSPEVWRRMWKDQVNLGLIPYYFFVERDTGAKHYFEVPLAKAFQIYREAYKKLSGLHRTVRGPSMSANPGKIAIEGIAKINGEKVFVLNFLQGRNPEWVKRPFFAEYDETATWLNDLTPAFGEDKFFFENELDEMLENQRLEKEKAFEKYYSN